MPRLTIEVAGVDVDGMLPCQLSTIHVAEALHKRDINVCINNLSMDYVSEIGFWSCVICVAEESFEFKFWVVPSRNNSSEV